MEMATRQATLRVEHENASRDRRDCTHPGSPHRPGTRNAYVTDGCHCTQCRAANRAEERHRTDSLRNGRWEPLVDAAPARGHLMRLRQNGVGLDQIVKISETPKRTIRRVLREPPSSPHRSRSETAQRVLAIQLSPEQLAPRSQVDATETHARIQALLEAGHSILELARALGRTSVSLRRTLKRRTVTAHTAMSVRDLYDRLHGNPFERVSGAAVPAGECGQVDRSNIPRMADSSATWADPRYIGREWPPPDVPSKEIEDS
jgi:hypothetical protein